MEVINDAHENMTHAVLNLFDVKASSPTINLVVVAQYISSIAYNVQICHHCISCRLCGGIQPNCYTLFCHQTFDDSGGPCWTDCTSGIF